MARNALTIILGSCILALVCPVRAQTVTPRNSPLYPLWRKDDTGYRVIWLQRLSPAERSEPQKQPEPRRTSYTSDRVAILAHLGIGAPAGALGMTLDLAPVRWFAVNTGLGLGSAGTQFAVTPRLRLAASQRVLFGIGTGLSFGPYRSSFPKEGLARWLALAGRASATLEWERAYWHNIEASIDVYPRSGALMFHFTVGRGYVTNTADRVCTDENEPSGYFDPDEGCDRTGGQSLFFAPVGIGFDV